jgi:hypothetical protein
MVITVENTVAHPTIHGHTLSIAATCTGHTGNPQTAGRTSSHDLTVGEFAEEGLKSLLSIAHSIQE